MFPDGLVYKFCKTLVIFKHTYKHKQLFIEILIEFNEIKKKQKQLEINKEMFFSLYEEILDNQQLYHHPDQLPVSFPLVHHR